MRLSSCHVSCRFFSVRIGTAFPTWGSAGAVPVSPADHQAAALVSRFHQYQARLALVKKKMKAVVKKSVKGRRECQKTMVLAAVRH